MCIRDSFKCEEYNFSELYGKDIAVVKLIILFALITILIGGMGIFAFSTFMVESKTREVALRKVNGATEWQIMQLFNQQFFARVLLACFIGLPVAYYASKEWLKGFAYKVEIHAGLFIFVFLTSVFVVLAITTWQTRKAARQNPIDTLLKPNNHAKRSIQNHISRLDKKQDLHADFFDQPDHGDHVLHAARYFRDTRV